MTNWNFFWVSLYKFNCFSVASGSTTTASFKSTIGALVGLITSFITIFFRLSSGFIELFCYIILLFILC